MNISTCDGVSLMSLVQIPWISTGVGDRLTGHKDVALVLELFTNPLIG